MTFRVRRATLRPGDDGGRRRHWPARSGAVAQVKTIEPGKLTIGMNGDMPMTQLKDGVLSGTDGELMIYVAKKLGLEPVVVQMDWAALIEATKQGKVDVMHGAMGWIEPRTKIMNLSDPIYYFGTLLAQKSANNFQHLRRHEGPFGRHRHRLHAGAGAEGRRRHRRSEALRHLRRRAAGSGRRPPRHGDPRSAAGAVGHRPASGMGAQAGAARARCRTSIRSCRPNTT